MEFTCFSGWEALPESADQLFQQAGRQSIFLTRAWFENLSQNGLEPDHSLLLAGVQDKEQLLALLPLLVFDKHHLKPLGNLYTSFYSLLIIDQQQEQVIDCLAEGLRESEFQSIRLAPFADNDAVMLRLQTAMEASGFYCHRYFRFYNWIETITLKTIDDYMQRRPSRVRNTVNRKQRKLQRDFDFSSRIFMQNDLSEGLGDYHKVYNASWKANEQFPDFIEGLATRFASEDWLRLGILYVDKQPVAAHFWFVAFKKASIFKLVYDQHWKHYSPGTVLMAEMLKQVIETDQVEEIDFLTGNDAYKQDWMSVRRERHGLYCAKITHARQNSSLTGKWFNALSRLININK